MRNMSVSFLGEQDASVPAKKNAGPDRWAQHLNHVANFYPLAKPKIVTRDCMQPAANRAELKASLAASITNPRVT